MSYSCRTLMTCILKKRREGWGWGEGGGRQEQTVAVGVGDFVGEDVQASVDLHGVGVDDLHAGEMGSEIDGQPRLSGPRRSHHHHDLLLLRGRLLSSYAATTAAMSDGLIRNLERGRLPPVRHSLPSTPRCNATHLYEENTVLTRIVLNLHQC
ncbi:hypothetical protein BHE74_00019900 [Ensete ventricosum]|nr:hypothetical protein GW17_00021588 [Ensete ventricosum]RWW72299.1 hypothetical protein BHE74_00019900 [Ensete ventricosum]